MFDWGIDHQLSPKPDVLLGQSGNWADQAPSHLCICAPLHHAEKITACPLQATAFQHAFMSGELSTVEATLGFRV